MAWEFPRVVPGDIVAFQPAAESGDGLTPMIVTGVDGGALDGLVFATGHAGGIPKWSVRHLDDPWVAEHPEVIDEDGGVFSLGSVRMDLTFILQAINDMADRLDRLDGVKPKELVSAG